MRSAFRVQSRGTRVHKSDNQVPEARHWFLFVNRRPDSEPYNVGGPEARGMDGPEARPIKSLIITKIWNRHRAGQAGPSRSLKLGLVN